MDLFSKNLELLKSNCTKHFMSMIEGYTESNLLEVDDQNSMLVRKNGRQVNSAINPEIEAELFCHFNDVLNNKANVIFIHDFKLGYEVENIVNSSKNATLIFVVIYDMDLFVHALKFRDLTKLLSSKNIIYLHKTERHVIDSSAIQICKVAVDVRALVLNHDSNYNDEIIKMNKYIYDKVEQTFVSIGNSIDDTLIGLEYALNNFEYMTCTDVISSKSREKGPAVCVAAGPSLEKNIEILRKYQDDVTIFAVDTIMDKLRENKIRFDYVATVERTELSYIAFFEDKPLEKDVEFLVNPVISRNILDGHPENNCFVFRENAALDLTFAKFHPKSNSRYYGSSCAHLNVAAADMMGYSPIILVGQDLAYGPDEKAHVSGTNYEDGPVGYIDEEMGGQVWVEDQNGNSIKSNLVWNLFRKEFEDYIKRYTPLVINSTEGGANIFGALNLILEDAISQYAKSPIGDKYDCLMKSKNEEVLIRRGNFIKGVIELEEQGKNIEKNIELYLSEIRKLILLCRSGVSIGDKAVLKEIITFANSFISSDFYSFLLQSNTIYFLRRQTKIGKTNTIEKQLQWLEEINRYFEIIKGTIDKPLTYIDKFIARNGGVQ